MASASFLSRVKYAPYHSKFAKPEDCLKFFKDGQYLGWSGFTGVGYPKMVPSMLADHVEKNKLQGKMRFNLLVGASSGPETDDRWASLRMLERRSPHQVGKNLQAGINNGDIKFQDKHLGEFPLDMLYGYYTMRRTDKPRNIDIAMVEATEILEDGSFIPGASVGTTLEVCELAEKIIIEVNTKLPSYKGIHDIYSVGASFPSKPIPLHSVSDRIGSLSVKVDPSKVVALVECNKPDNTTNTSDEDDNSAAIAHHIADFLQYEVRSGRLPQTLLPLQSGIGNIANAIIAGLAKGPFKNVTVWTEVLQDAFLDFFDHEQLLFASATSLRLTPDGFQRLYKDFERYKSKILLRPQQLSNSAELIRRLGIIAMNTPVEFDLYGHANSTLVNGSRMINGIGGSNDFLRNGKLSFMHAPSTRPTKTDPHGISTIVPFCTHVDQTEHDVDVFVTEQGVADLRGLAPRERPLEIIKHCAHPYYRDQLMEYYNESLTACLKSRSAHEPHQLDRAFKMHLNLSKEGTMKLKSWN